MEYRLPTRADEVELRRYRSECSGTGEHDVLLAQELCEQDYPAWVELIEGNACQGKADWGRSLLLLCCEDGELVGILTIRPELSKELAAIYGHIGYAVRPSKRRRGYATQMLRHALDVCRESGLKSAVLGCYKDNAASVAVIEKCGGVLIDESENYTPGRRSLYFEIRLA